MFRKLLLLLFPQLFLEQNKHLVLSWISDLEETFPKVQGKRGAEKILAGLVERIDDYGLSNEPEIIVKIDNLKKIIDQMEDIEFEEKQ